MSICPIADLGHSRDDARMSGMEPHRHSIDREHMFNLLLEADPSFRPRWRDFLSEWGNEASLPLYLALSSLAEHLIERLQSGDTQGFDAIFEVVERWHVEGDTYVREAATIGLLESIQNLLGGSEPQREGMKALEFERWMQPETKQWWIKLYAYWYGDKSALRDNG